MCHSLSTNCTTGQSTDQHRNRGIPCDLASYGKRNDRRCVRTHRYEILTRRRDMDRAFARQ